MLAMDVTAEGGALFTGRVHPVSLNLNTKDWRGRDDKPIDGETDRSPPLHRRLLAALRG